MFKLSNYVKLLIESDDISSDYEFVGFHRQKRARPSKYDDIIGEQYASDYFSTLFHECLTYDDQDKAKKFNYMEYDWNDQYQDDFDKMANEASDFLYENGYRWIFVTENKPHGIDAYGNYIYKIYFRKNDVLGIIDDPFGADDIAYAYVYKINAPPKEELYSNNI